MGSGRLDDHFPEDDGGEQSPPLCYHEILENLCPDYMAMGMSWDEYWYGDPLMTIAYRKAYELKSKSRNHDAWLQGMYIYEALVDVAPILRAFSKESKPTPYPDKPYALTEEEAKKRKEKEEVKRDQKNQATIKAWADRVNRIKSEKERNVVKANG